MKITPGEDALKIVETTRKGLELYVNLVDKAVAEFENIDSKILLRKTLDIVATRGYSIGNIDCTVCAERPKLNPHIPQMQQTLAQVMGIDTDAISIKATTTEHLGFTGREEGISAYAVVLLEKEM